MLWPLSCRSPKDKQGVKRKSAEEEDIQNKKQRADGKTPSPKKNSTPKKPTSPSPKKPKK